MLFIGWKEPQRDSLFAEWLTKREQTVVGNRSFTIVGQKKIRFKPLRINEDIEQAKPVKLRIDTTKVKKIE